MKMIHLISSIRMLRYNRFIFICCLISLFSIEAVYSTHIVGGSIRYNCLGDNMYEVILSIKRDCNLGADDAPFDDPASIGIFDLNGNPMLQLGDNGQLFLDFEGDKNLQNEIQQICFSNSNEICVHSTEYRGVLELPMSPGGYTLTYQRCCRNSSLVNVVSPLETGMTLKIELFPRALELCNSSPAFKLSPDIFICAGDRLEFDGSATDSEGDDLLYSLCTPLSGATEAMPQPQPPAAPPYDFIDWAAGYDALNPLGQSDAQFDPISGMFSVMPTTQGQFLVGMCVEEYRDSELLSIVTREFQYNVVVCSGDFASDFSVQQDGCSLEGVQFTNNTPSASDYTWFFNYPNTDPAYMSTDPNPVFSYPQAGTYTIRLVTNVDGSNCESIVDRNVTIADGQGSEIQTSVLACDGDTYTFRVADPIVDRTQRQWIIFVNGVQQSGTTQFIDFEANRNDLIEVELTTTSATGCVETNNIELNANLIDFTSDLITCSTDNPNQLRVRLTPALINGLFNNPIVSYVWNASNGETVIESTDPILELDADFAEKLWVGLTVVFENGCTAEVERNIRPFGVIFDTAPIESDNGSSTVTFFNNDEILINLFDNPNSAILDERIVRKDWIILSPSQGELRGEGSSIEYTSTTNETIEVLYIYTTESGCVFEIRRTYTFVLSDLCLTLSPTDNICQILAEDPNSGLADLDCDNDGVSNSLECNNGTDPNNPEDACTAVQNAGLDICTILESNPDSELAQLDCDDDGISNAEECEGGSDPSDGCDVPSGENEDICAILMEDPDSPLGMLDCDNGGLDNSAECENGGDPNDPSDDCQVILSAGINICTLLAENPQSPLAGLDCDGDGFSNADECQNGSDPSNGCDIPAGETIDICAILNDNPDSPLADLDCDGDGFSNANECQNGSDPSDGCDIPDGETIDICAILAADPNSPLGMFDCDGGGIDNATECENGGDPNDPTDECQVIQNAGIDICQFLSENPDSPIAALDCDNDGVDNGTECINGTDPNAPSDACQMILNGELDICQVLLGNPDSELGALDCDGDGFSNKDECDRGSDPADGCDIPDGETYDICAILAADPNSPLGMFDCDGGGIDNATECQNGGDPNDPSDDCQSAINGTVDICAILAADPNSVLANLDCDGDGFTNQDECDRGGDPIDGCVLPDGETIDICAILAANPDSPLGQFDCDGDTFSNLDECNRGSDPTDGCDIPEGETIDICAILEADPNSPLADQDCDGGGIDNGTECENGGDPNDPTDECLSAFDDSVDICAILAANPDSPLADLDCDGDGFTNEEECNSGSDPADGCDIPAGETIDICAILEADPDSPLGMFDCDNGGIDNATECENGGDPNDPSDDCQSAIDGSVDICAILAADPNSPLANLDCDGDGFSNIDECNAGSDPTDGCDIPAGETIDICAILEADPDSPLGMFDCDGGGVDNETECENGGDPNDPSDECESILDGSFDICAFLVENPDSPLGLLDCDGDGVDNKTECDNGTDPLDPTDNCPTSVEILRGDGGGIPDVICAGTDTPISVSIVGQDSLFFEWGPSDCIVSGGMTATPIVNASSDKELTLRVLNEMLGCENEYTIPLVVSDPSVSITSNPSEPINRGENVELTAETDATDPMFDWSNGETNQSFDIDLDEATDFMVTITDAFGCMATASTTVDVNAALCNSDGIFLPNSFSPNGDNLNDILFVRSNAIQDLEFSIFDRWGREVFSSTSIDEGWNGRWQNTGDELPSDAYGYWIRATCFTGEEFVQQGNVSILR